MINTPTALTIAGSDSGGGAGIQADLKTFMALNVYGYSAVTSITAQNTTGISEILELPGSLVYQQMKAAALDTRIDAAKTGMLSNADIVVNVGKAIADFGIEKLVVDPVIKSKDGSSLLKDDAMKAFLSEIVPRALVITPNIAETKFLAGMEVKSVHDMEQATMKISQLGAKVVVVKGGHLPINKKAIDVVGIDRRFEYLENDFIKTRNTHGIGCTFSAAIAAYLAKGDEVMTAIRSAREYVQGALLNEIDIGKGWGPLNHGWIWQR